MHQNKNQNKHIHIPVLSSHVLHYLDPKAGETYLDLTAGYGGHATLILERTLYGKAHLVDRDTNAIEYLRQTFKDKEMVTLRHQDFRKASEDLVQTGQSFDLILADLGVSSPHLNIAERGFSILRDGPLDMRMDQTQELTAATIVNTWSAADLKELIQKYGEDPHSGQIARHIVENRPFETTHELADSVAGIVKRGRSNGKTRIHPATRLFQALRMRVNDELEQLAQSLPLWLELLAPGGRLAVISFHSLEDRLVKQILKDHAGERYDADFRLLTPKPVTADADEIVFNPRSRSAKLRAVVKIKTPK